MAFEQQREKEKWHVTSKFHLSIQAFFAYQADV